MTDVLRQNALYGTGAGSGDGIHPNAGKTGTTENHADAWFDGYTRQLSTVVWMGYPKGEIPMLNVHGQAVAGATFPVPIWHEYMAAALWHHKVLGFQLPDSYPSYRSITRGNYGSFGSYYARRRHVTTTTTRQRPRRRRSAATPSGEAAPARPYISRRDRTRRATGRRAPTSRGTFREHRASVLSRGRAFGVPSSAAAARIAPASAPRSAGRDEQRRLAVAQELSRRRRVSGHHRRSGRERVEHDRRDRSRFAEAREHDPGVRNAIPRSSRAISPGATICTGTSCSDAAIRTTSAEASPGTPVAKWTTVNGKVGDHGWR